MPNATRPRHTTSASEVETFLFFFSLFVVLFVFTERSATMLCDRVNPIPVRNEMSASPGWKALALDGVEERFGAGELEGEGRTAATGGVGVGVGRTVAGAGREGTAAGEGVGDGRAGNAAALAPHEGCQHKE